MIKEKFMLYQEAFAENGVLYTLMLDVPYSANNTKESAQTRLSALAPEDIALGSIAKFHSEDENGSEFIWTFEWEQNEEEEKLFMLTHETYIDRVPNGEVVPTGTIEITENGEGINVSEYAYADVNVSGGGGFDVPTFALDERWSCDMTYEEAKASYVATVDENGAGLAYTSRANVGSIKIWTFDVLMSGDALSYFVDVPETVNEGLAVLSESGDPLTLFADDGNFYGLAN